MNRLSFVFLCAVLMTTLACLSGCGGQPTSGVDVGGTEGGAVTGVINDLGEANPTAWKQAFVAGSAPSPAVHKQMNVYTFRVGGTPKVTGNEATVLVKITTRKEGKEVGEKEWTLTKEGETWKIKTAPLP